MNILIVGSGAREHAIAWKLRQSPGLTALYAAPGNAGFAQLANISPLTIPKPYAPQAEIDEFLATAVRLARDVRADLVVIGPEDPLSFGLADRLEAEGIAAFGPSAAAARIETSKAFAKDLMREAGIAFAASAAFSDFEAAKRYVESREVDVVVKADGLSAGKGVTVTASHEGAIARLRELLLDGALGDAGRSVVVEDRLSGSETSAHAFTDGVHVAHMPFACDHKPIFDGDRGPNTGGMGAYSPPSWLSEDTAGGIRREITEAVLRAMASHGMPYRGVLFPGLMITSEGPRVIEFNCRFGDPEAQVLLPRLESDLLDVMLAVANGTLDRIDLRWSALAAVTIVLASAGYPGSYETDKRIDGLEDVDADVLVFHAGTKRASNGTVVTAGGRVLSVTALAPSMADARAKAYANVARIRFDGMHYRTDIGARELAVHA